MKKFWIALAILICHPLVGCGSALPTLDVSYPEDQDFADFVNSIAAHVRCETAVAVLREYSPTHPKRRILADWAAKIALNIKAYDRGVLNPSVQAMSRLGDFVIGASGTFETNATREVTITYFVPFLEIFRTRAKYVTADNHFIECARNPAITHPIAGSLAIYQSLHAAFSAYDSNRVLSDDLIGGPFETITHHVNFQVQAGLGVSPSWAFTQVSVNPSSVLGATNRAQTNDLLITFGPALLGTRKLINNSRVIGVSLPSPALDESFNIERLRTTIGNVNLNR